MTRRRAPARRFRARQARDTASRRCRPMPVSHIPGDTAGSLGTHLRPPLLPGSGTRRHPSLHPAPAAKHRPPGAARCPPAAAPSSLCRHGEAGWAPGRRRRARRGTARHGTASSHPTPAQPSPARRHDPRYPAALDAEGVQGDHTGLRRPGVLKGQRASLGRGQRLCPGGARRAGEPLPFPVPAVGRARREGRGLGVSRCRHSARRLPSPTAGAPRRSLCAPLPVM